MQSSKSSRTTAHCSTQRTEAPDPALPDCAAPILSEDPFRNVTPTKVASQTFVPNDHESLYFDQFPQPSVGVSDTQAQGSQLRLPEFAVDPNKVRVLRTPKEFFDYLVRLYGSAERRAVLAALYVGTAEPERQVISAIISAAHRKARRPAALSSLVAGRACEGSGRKASGESADRRSTSTTCSETKRTDDEGRDDFEQLEGNAGRRDLPQQVTIGTAFHAEASSVSASMKDQSELSEGSLEKEAFSEPFAIDILIDAARGQRKERDGRSSLSILQSLSQLATVSNSVSSTRPPKNDLPLDPTASDPTTSTSSPGHSFPCPSPEQSSSSLSVNIHLFHSPLLSGILQQILPPRINEVLGVFHTKIFLVDNTVVLTGANLSESYLDDRQDRYVVIEDNAELTDFLVNLVRLLQRFSFHVEKVQSNSQAQSIHQTNKQRRTAISSPTKEPEAFNLRLNHGIPDPRYQPNQFCQSLGTALAEFLDRYQVRQGSPSHSDTTVFVALQCGFAFPQIRQEEKMLSLLLADHQSSKQSVPSTECSTPSVSRVLPQDGDLSNSSSEKSYAFHINSEDSTKPLLSDDPFISRPSHSRTLKNQRQFDWSLRTSFLSFAFYVLSLPYFLLRFSTKAIRKTSRSLSSATNRFQSSCSTQQPFVGNPLGHHPATHLQPAIASGAIGHIVLASGYLNMPDVLLESLAIAALGKDEWRFQEGFLSPTNCSAANLSAMGNSHRGCLELFIAAPEANSFYQSKGLSGYIPLAYSYMGALQLERLQTLWAAHQRRRLGFADKQLGFADQQLGFADQQLGTFGCGKEMPEESSLAKLPLRTGASALTALMGAPASLYEYHRPGWTFHSKGLWLYPPPSPQRPQPHPIATVIGSSNFGLRSVSRDLDLSFLIKTTNPALQAQFHQEVSCMRQYGRPINADGLAARCPHWLRFFLRWTRLKTLL